MDTLAFFTEGAWTFRRPYAVEGLWVIADPLVETVPPTVGMHVGDTEPAIELRLQDRYRVPINLTGKRVLLRLVNNTGNKLVFAREAVLTEPTDGKCQLRWVEGDTRRIGDYTLEIQLEYEPGHLQTAARIALLIT